MTNIEESVILFSEERKFMAFGKKAVELYIKSNKPETLCFIRNFNMKMNLATRQDIYLWRAADQRGRGYVFLLDVYAETIGFMKSKVEEMAEESFPGVTSFRWVLTFPETWEPVAKEFLKEAALRAGIPQSRLYLEKEHVSAVKWQQMCQYSDQIEKSKCLFVDLGGGSTKIYAGTEKETFVETIADSGGITILKAFENCLDEMFSRQVLESYKLKERADYFKLFGSFMRKSHDLKLVPPSRQQEKTSNVGKTVDARKDETKATMASNPSHRYHEKAPTVPATSNLDEHS
ncbi:heat shock 70 kDa protein 12A-like [Saccostrea echinata]|uniref:heat shock 70 kDa protein 12A-like n=1 Tax=Saccostrea echinata TaxID=191078 RepID=UPI002A82568C|nr:heat shock 70 kDa protein 12A-like [Saccostrea echinata]